MSSIEKRFSIFCAEYLVLVSGVLFGLCALFGKTFFKSIEIILVGGMLLVISLTIAKILKKVIRKARPLKRTEMFQPFDRYAFPSAHSASLFALTAYILGQNLLIGVLSLICTVLIVVGRVKTHVHDYVDIAGGFVIGVAVTFYTAPYIIIYVTTYLIPALFLN
jgi:membrane-associated phospholipid phosphatase